MHKSYCDGRTDDYGTASKEKVEKMQKLMAWLRILAEKLVKLYFIKIICILRPSYKMKHDPAQEGTQSPQSLGPWQALPASASP